MYFELPCSQEPSGALSLASADRSELDRDWAAVALTVLFKGRDMRSVVLRCYEQITANGKMQLFRSYKPEYADGEQLRDFLYVKDAAKMSEFLFNSGAGGIYNVGSGRAEDWLTFVGGVFAAMGKTPEIEFIDMPEKLRGKYQYYTCADPGKHYSQSVQNDCIFVWRCSGGALC